MKKFEKIYIEITNVCNLKCDFCIDSNRKKEFMSKEKFKIILEKIKEYTNLVLLHIKGEPLLHPELEYILKECEESGICVNLTTNTTLLAEKKQILKNSKSLRQLNLSMHSFSQNNMEIEENCKSIFKIVKELKDNNKDLIISYRLWNLEALVKNDINLDMLRLLGKEYDISNIEERCKNEKYIKLAENVFLNQDIEFAWPRMNSKIINQNGKCYGLKNQIGILVNGDVVPCCLDQNGDIKLGNIFEQNLEDILNSRRAEKMVNGFRNRELTEELCKRCGFMKLRIK